MYFKIQFSHKEFLMEFKSYSKTVKAFHCTEAGEYSITEDVSINLPADVYIVPIVDETGRITSYEERKGPNFRSEYVPTENIMPGG
jgi:hypothetical protein